jgi:hypothetical protein
MASKEIQVTVKTVLTEKQVKVAKNATVKQVNPTYVR